MPERYELLGLLGKGGFGRVYLARYHGEAGFQKDVALKFLKPGAQDDHDLIARLRDEARLLGLLRHRAIVHVDRLIRLEGTWVIVMEYVPGKDLSHLLRKGPIPAGAALEVLAEVASALGAAFERPSPTGQPLRLTHRDIKPSNIRLTTFGDVKVLDFGIARAEFAGQEVSGDTVLVGTPSYMAPERFEGFDGPASDIFSLGIVAYEMLTAQRFGQRKSPREAHGQHVKLRIGRLQRCEGLPPAAASLIGRMLSYEPGRRPTTSEVRRMLRRLAGSCDTTLAEWADITLDDASLPGVDRASVGLTGMSGTSIILGAKDGAGLITGALVSKADGRPYSLDTTGHLVGRIFVPDSDGPIAAPTNRPNRKEAEENQTTQIRPAQQERSWRKSGVVVAGLAVALALFAVGFSVRRTTYTTRNSDGAVPPTSAADRASRAREIVMASPAADEVTDGSSEAPRGNEAGERRQEVHDDEATSLAANEPSSLEQVGSTSSGSATRQDAPGLRADDPWQVTPPSGDALPPRPTVGVLVSMVGDAQSVRLQGEAGTYSLPSRVPPGAYEVRVAFPGEPSEAAGTVTVAEGRPLVLKCERMWRECTPQ